jgi:hypothetical protein
MGSFKNHKELYIAFKKDAENRTLSIPSRMELYFLSIFHLIEACAAKYNYHIQKHQKVRFILEGDSNIFNDKTETIWRLFQEIETRLRPKFSYGFSWSQEDFESAINIYKTIEEICLKVIKNVS